MQGTGLRRRRARVRGGGRDDGGEARARGLDVRLRRLEILSAQANGLLLLIIGIWIVFGAIRRLVSPSDVQGGVVLAVALVGIAVNLAATVLLSRASRESLNVRGAFLHVGDRPGGVHRNGCRRRAHPRHRVGSLRPDRRPLRRRAHVLGRLGVASRVDADLPRGRAGRHRARRRGPRAVRGARGRRGARPARLDADGRISDRSPRTFSSPRAPTATRSASGSSTAWSSCSGSSTRRSRSSTLAGPVQIGRSFRRRSPLRR